jgi:DivIVA domain-containing protein
MRKKPDDAREAGFTTSGRKRGLTAMDVQQKEFRLAFRGYNERDVDEFLDLITEELAAREGGDLGSPQGAGPVDALREADDIRARARQEAEAIIRDAEVQAAAILGSAAGGPADQRAVLAPYLTREREFLQSLGRLVQDHAEGVKRMVRMAAERSKSQVIRIEGAEPIGTGGAVDAAENEQSMSRTSSAEPSGEAQASVRELFWGED